MVGRLIALIISLVVVGFLADFVFCGCILPMDQSFFDMLAEAAMILPGKY